MKLRSGKITDGLCVKCNKYFGNPEWEYKCSSCAGITYPICFDDPKFQSNLATWVKSKLISSEIKKVLIHVCHRRFSMNDTNFIILRHILHVIKTEGKYISAKLAEKLCRKTGEDTWNKSQLILQFVIDWWNMSDYNFNSTELCYFGRYGDIAEFRTEIKSIPPPPPNQPLNEDFII